MGKAWLSLGANIGDAKAQLLQAIKLLNENLNIEVIQQSKIIITEPWGNKDQNHFHNMAIEIETILYPEALLRTCLDIEQQMGRKRKEKWGPRLIDIDIIAIERIEVKTKNLTLPHPHAFERDFVMKPLREISPKTADWIILQAKKNPS